MNNLKPLLPFQAYPWQVPVWKCQEPIMLLTGGAGGGKSKVVAEKMHGLMLKYPGSTGLILRKSRESMVNSTLIFLDREVMGDDERVIHKENKHRFEYVNGSVLAYGGMKDEAQREQVRSIGQKGSIDFTWMEEANAFKEEDFNEILARMRGNSAGWRQIILSTNPDAAKHWINKRLILGGEAKVFFSMAKDNPANDAQYLKTLQSLTGVQKARLCDGLWVQAEGVIYKNFRPDTQVVEDTGLLHDNLGRLSFMSYKRIMFGADSNFPKPRACLLAGFRGDGSVDIIDEFYKRNAHVEELGEWLVKWQKRTGNAIKGFHDPSDPDAIAKLDKLPMISCDKANNRVIPGISEVSRYFDSNIIRISKRCVSLIGELESYSWRKGSEEEEPEKENDHAVDALRYLLNSVKEVRQPQNGMVFVK